MAKPLTLAQAKKLRVGQTLYDRYYLNADGTAQRWRVNGKVQTWKTRPQEVRVPLKYGLYTYGELTDLNLDSVSLDEPAPVAKKNIKGNSRQGYHR
ncbi:MAG: hypothetical protein WC489_06175 [Patescibacteria group bacterium]|jgi:hypothetical protein